jgi:hypothetical protein
MIDTAKNNTSESNNVTQPILTAIQKLVPNAKLDKFTLSASVVNMSNTYTLTEDYSFTVIGVTNQTGTLVNANLAFLHMNTTQSVKIHGNELNSVGSTYLVQSMNGLTRQNYDFYIDGSQSLTTQIPVQTTIRFWLLDYTWTPVIAAWNNTRNLVGQQTIWRYHPPTARYNLTLGRKSPEGTTYLAKGVAIFNPSLSITVPANAESNSNTVTFTVPNSEEIIMPVLIGIVIIILAITLVLDHRYSHRIVTSSRTRKKR